MTAARAQRALVRWWRGGLAGSSLPAGKEVPVTRGPAYTGEYLALHVYLRDRFADRVTLTFSQIEDLLGFPLPSAARLESDWWRGPQDDVGLTRQAQAWRLASRTAVADLPASSILFERQLASTIAESD